MAHWMNLRVKCAISIVATLALVSGFSNSVCADRICDYEFESGCGHLIVSNRSAEKCVALTFDDGPHKTYTPEILDILDKYNAKATFFIIGENAENNPEIVLETYRRGHEIGNHTYSHPDLKRLSVEKSREEILKTQEILTDITREAPKLFRPPGGYVSNALVDSLFELNCSVVLWSWRQDTRDWSCPTVTCIVNGVLKNLKDGDIILFHDYNAAKSSPTPEALDTILQTLSEQGYRFVTVSELHDMD